VSKFITRLEEEIIIILKSDLNNLLEEQQGSKEIKVAEYDFLQLHRIVELMEKLIRLAHEADSHMMFTKNKYHQLEFAYMELQEKYDELIDASEMEERLNL